MNNEINKKEAPEGYIAIQPINQLNSFPDISSCNECDFLNIACNRSVVLRPTCCKEDRKDKNDVIFKKV